METPNTYTFQLKLNRHKLAYQLLDEDAIRLGGVSGLKSLKIYHIYLPLIIGIIIIAVGFIMDFILTEAAGAVILLYAAYGSTLVKGKIAGNKITKVIRTGELEITQEDKVTTLTAETIKEFKITIERVTKENYEGRLTVTDSENTEYFILGIFGADKNSLEADLIYFKEYIQLRLNAASDK